MLRPRSRPLSCLCQLSMVSLVLHCSGWAQESDPKPASVETYTQEFQRAEQARRRQEQSSDASEQNRSMNFGAVPPSLPQELQKPYLESLKAFQVAVGDLRKISLAYHATWDSREDIDRLRKFGLKLNETQDKLDNWRKQLAIVYAHAPHEAENIRNAMLEMLARDVQLGIYEGLLPIAKSLMDHDTQLTLTQREMIGLVAFANNDLALAELAWKAVMESGKASPLTAYYFERLPEQRERWKQEEECRSNDAQRDDNPRVSLLTGKGLIVIELFENEAPQAVANFIFLVEKKFYHRKAFFRVIDHTGAQTGCDRDNGSGNAGYVIRGEMNDPGHRSIFRGSVVLVSGVNEITNELDPDSGSSQFVITSLPQPELEGKQTAFGRVIAGLPILGTLNRIDLTSEQDKKDPKKIPDYLIEARVERKRDHLYQPTPVRGQLP